MFKSKLPPTHDIDVLYGRLTEASALRLEILHGRFKTLEEVADYLEARDTTLHLERSGLLQARSQLLEAELVEQGLSLPASLPASTAPSCSENPEFGEVTEEGPLSSVSSPTYSQLVDRIYDYPHQPASAILDQVDEATRRAWVVLFSLAGRSGFDDWFHDIDRVVQDEIFEEMRKALRSA